MVSAALLRVMGGDVAELPLVATSRDVQGLVGIKGLAELHQILILGHPGCCFYCWIDV